MRHLVLCVLQAQANRRACTAAEAASTPICAARGVCGGGSCQQRDVPPDSFSHRQTHTNTYAPHVQTAHMHRQAAGQEKQGNVLLPLTPHPAHTPPLPISCGAMKLGGQSTRRSLVSPHRARQGTSNTHQCSRPSSALTAFARSRPRPPTRRTTSCCSCCHPLEQRQQCQRGTLLLAVAATGTHPV